ncbi:MAG TPA: hypothetical protein VMM12_14585 [Longimicrobiales bacterium]|nr:hypothetical protein [Longimicrobiales bacterium]
MEAIDLWFMPLVDDFSGGRVRGAVTRSDLATVVDRFGLDARVLQVRPVLLPNVPADTPVGQLASLAGPAPAYVVTERGGRLIGIYEPDRRRTA